MTLETWVDPTLADLASYPPQTVFEASLCGCQRTWALYPHSFLRTPLFVLRILCCQS